MDDKISTSELGKRLRELRVLKGVKQKDLSRISGVSLDYVNKIENSRVKNIGHQKLEALAKALSVEPSFLLYGVKQEKKIIQPRPLSERIPILGYVFSDASQINWEKGRPRLIHTSDEKFSKDGIEYILRPEHITDPDAFVIEVEGNGVPVFSAGARIICSPNEPVDDGTLLFAKLKNDPLTYLRFFKRLGTLIQLTSLSVMPPTMCDEKDCEILCPIRMIDFPSRKQR